MDILFLSHYFPPEVNAPATRTYEHCREWVAQGHKVTVISCVPNHPMGRAYPDYKNKLYSIEEKDGIKIIRLLTYITANEGFLKRTLSYLFYMIMSIIAAPFVAKADIVVSTSPQFFNGLAGYFVSRIKRAPWVLEIRDLWPESILALGAIKNSRAIGLLEWIECFAYRKADHVVPVTESFKKHIIVHGGDADKITVIPNGVDLNQFQQTDLDNELVIKWGLQDKFIASYVGTHGLAHGLDTILDAAELLRDSPHIVFLMVGDGAERERLLDERKRRQLTNVVMQGQQPKELMPKIWAMTDVSLVLLKKLDLFKTVIPSKIFESMAMSTPILLGVDGEVKDIVEASGAGVCIEPESANQLAIALVELNSNQDYYRELQARGRCYVSENYDRLNLARKYLDLLELTKNCAKLKRL